MNGTGSHTDMHRDEADLDVVFRRGDWHSWREAIEWLRVDGMDDSELSRNDAERLIDDLSCLERDRMAFTDDPRLAAQLIRTHASHC